jgi:hypothetical protein
MNMGGYEGTWARVHGYAGKRVRVQRVFFQKTLPSPSQTRTRVPVYPPISGHGYGYRGYGRRVHGYGLYPAGFSKQLVMPGCDLRQRETNLGWG